MTTNYDEIAEEYKRAKQQAWRLCIEHFTLFKLVGDLSGKTVLDLACGEGFYTRFIKRRGAARAVGVDISHGILSWRAVRKRGTGWESTIWFKMPNGSLLTRRLTWWSPGICSTMLRLIANYWKCVRR